ncbi:ATP-binding protein [Pseudarthrobacter sp. MEB009]|uniref:ATP-binding protein n=1 Tax=Pseudarthrobacter sp. MEB009 TaxID=3040326 RepID=UPI00255446B8|nr:ATP-binding protein [Pseudarthrobacter sp. MEB009]
MAKIRQRHPDRGTVLHGLRGVGKTVLLNEFLRRAERADLMVITLERRGADGGLAAVRAKLARSLLQAGRKHNTRIAGAKLKAALGSLASFSAKLGVTGIDIGVALNHGRADSGSIEVDLEDLVEDLSQALAETRSGLVFIIDEMQDLDSSLMAALLSVQHLANQREWPFYISLGRAYRTSQVCSVSRATIPSGCSPTEALVRSPRKPPNLLCLSPHQNTVSFSTVKHGNYCLRRKGAIPILFRNMATLPGRQLLRRPSPMQSP